ncbi:hypothetical protein OSTOST_22490, partial [Ostertagia ostertagi]
IYKANANHSYNWKKNKEIIGCGTHDPSIEVVVKNSAEAYDTTLKFHGNQEKLSEKVIRGIQSIPKNYPWMVETITKRYGNKPANKSRIVQKLFELKPASKKADSCQECYDSVKTLVNQMKYLRPMWSETILKKFPYEIVKNILVKHQETDTMEIDSLLEALDREITAKAYVESRLGETHPARESNLGMTQTPNKMHIL